MSDATQPTSSPGPSSEEKALLIRSLWESLLAPEWVKDDLILLGKLVFAKVPLRSIDEATMAHLLPKLKAISEHLWKKLSSSSPAAPAAPPKKEGEDGR
jgi:hypothetical protein